MWCKRTIFGFFLVLVLPVFFVVSPARASSREPDGKDQESEAMESPPEVTYSYKDLVKLDRSANRRIISGAVLLPTGIALLSAVAIGVGATGGFQLQLAPCDTAKCVETPPSKEPTASEIARKNAIDTVLLIGGIMGFAMIPTGIILLISGSIRKRIAAEHLAGETGRLVPQVAVMPSPLLDGAGISLKWRF